MSSEQMRAKVLAAYPGGNWANKVAKMSDTQVAAVYLRMLNNTPARLNRRNK